MVGLELIEPSLALARVHAAVEDDLFRKGLLQCGALGDRVEAVDVELAEVGRQHDRHVAITVLEQILGRPLDAVIEEALPRPALPSGRHAGVTAPETLDESQTVAISTVLRP